MSKIESGLQSALIAERQKRQQLEAEKVLMLPVFQKHIWKVVKKDFPEVNQKVQELAVQGSHYPHAQVLNAIAEEQYPNKSYDSLYENLKEIDPEIAQVIGEKGLDFMVLGAGNSYPSSGWKNNKDIAVSTEEWWAILPSELRDWDEDEEHAKKIRDAISGFESDLTNEIYTYLEKEKIEVEDLDKYILESDVWPAPIFIKEVDEDGLIFVEQGLLNYRSDDETKWEFINSHRGSLIGRSQIVNPDLLPDFLSNETIFVIE